jgi:hypothetical protein
MRGTSGIGLLAIGAVATLGAAGMAMSLAVAQETNATDPEPGDGPTAAGVAVEVGTVRYRLPAEEALAACVDARTEALGGATLLLRPFVRGVDDGWLALPGFPAEAAGALAGARAGDCFALAPAPFTR